MLYDNWALHLEKSDFEIIEKALPELEAAHDDGSRRVSATSVHASQWKSCFDTVLTEVRDAP